MRFARAPRPPLLSLFQFLSVFRAHRLSSSLDRSFLSSLSREDERRQATIYLGWSLFPFPLVRGHLLFYRSTNYYRFLVAN